MALPRRVGRNRLAFRLVLGLLALSIPSVSAQDDPDAKKRLEYMQAAVVSLDPSLRN